MVRACEFTALGTGVRVLAAGDRSLEAARAAVERELTAVDEACSRFRPDSELVRAQGAAGRAVPVSTLLAQIVAASLRAARMTGGAVDPTVGTAMRRIGYDRDFALVADGDPGAVPLRVEPVPGWRSVELDASRRLLRVPAGVELDFGSTAKAFAADLAARSAAAAAGCGVLVSLGGDIAMAGPPPEDGWRVLVAEDHAAPLDGPGQVIRLAGGALATSSTTVRRWRRGDTDVHHIVDPATGMPAAGRWRTATVGAATCVDANAAATASIVWGDRAADWLRKYRLPTRLVAQDGSVVLVAGWPEEGGAG
ncbi:MAG TPA: FAD:protein FMN transferase [Terriglobales bacterium]|nr:FAD:protein FMN transferase [Terriglobales bacterium]